MAYNEELDERIAETISNWGTQRKKMFGGTCHLLKGNMLCGVNKDYLILRLGEHVGSIALKKPFVKPFDITGRPMKGWVRVAEGGFQGSDLEAWLDKARDFVETLPPK